MVVFLPNYNNDIELFLILFWFERRITMLSFILKVNLIILIFGLLVYRLALGISMFYHGYLKVIGAVLKAFIKLELCWHH